MTYQRHYEPITQNLSVSRIPMREGQLSILRLSTCHGIPTASHTTHDIQCPDLYTANATFPHLLHTMNTSRGNTNPAALEGASLHRMRTKNACEPCRQRKRKCDGKEPCSSCSRYIYECYYGTPEGPGFPARKKPTESTSKSKGAAQGHGSTQSQDTGSSQYDSPTKSRDPQDGILDPVTKRFSAASSGVAFPRMLGINIDAEDAPRLHSFAWNLGMRNELQTAHTDITQLVSFAVLQRLAAVYFEHIHPIYGFLSQERFAQKAIDRWSNTAAADDFDLVCCGVVALGSLFLPEPSHVQEAELMQHARMSLDSSVKFPSIDRIAAWILRTLYSRLTTRPHVAWISSSVTMQLIEVTGIHHDLDTISVVHPPNTPMDEQDAEQRRGLFWVARSLNAFLSYEVGFSSMNLPAATCKPIAPNSLNYTHELMALYFAWEKIQLIESTTACSLEDCLSRLQEIELHHNGLVLHQTNLAFCVYRRLRLRNSNFSKKALDLLVTMGNTGLKASNNMLQLNVPWWHIAMVPFQYVCVLLAIDSRHSLLYVGDAMRTLEAATQRFDTHVMREALMTAGLLLREWKKRKEELIGFLGEGLQYQQTSMLNQLNEVLQSGVSKPVPTEWPANVDFNMPGTTDLNWDLFLGGPNTLF